MQLSIIIPTYNRRRIIRYTLDSVAPKFHSGLDYEVIVVDDGSTDDTMSMIVDDYPWVRVIRNTAKGAPSARNTGLGLAKGKYIQYLDSDDLVGPDYFLAKIRYLESHNEVNACYGAYEFFNSDGEFTEQTIIFKHKYPIIALPGNDRQHLLNYLSGNYLPPNAIVWRRDFLLAIKGHDSSLAINQDVELVIRGIFNNVNMVAVEDSSRVLIRNHSIDARVGNAGNEGRKWGQILELRKKIFSELEQHGYTDSESRQMLSTYVFNIWKMLRHNNRDVAVEYLKFAKEVYWPLKINGNIIFRALGTLLGPVKAVEVKYFLLKRD